MTLALATFDDVEALSRPVLGDDRPRVARLIEMISAAVVAYTGQRFVQETETVAIWPTDGVLRLPQLPVTAVDEVTQDGAALAATAWEWTPTGYVRPTVPTSWVFNAYDEPTTPLWSSVPMTVTYTHGYPAGSYPLDVTMVVAERVARMWAYGGVEDVQSESIDGYQVRYGRNPTTSSGGWSPEHRAILDAYRRSGAASLRLS